MTGTRARTRLRSRWQKWRRDPAGFAAGLPSPGLSWAMLFALAGVTVAADRLDGRDRRAAAVWRSEGAHLARGSGDDLRFSTQHGGAPSIWPDCALVEPIGAAAVVAAFSEDGARITAALLAPDRPGLLWLGRRPAACRVYRVDGAPPPNRLAVRPAGRAEASRSLRRHGVSLADALRAAWPLVEPPRWSPDGPAYRGWIARNEPRPSEAPVIAAWLASQRGLPSIAVLLVAEDERPDRLQQTLRSIQDQAHGDWRLFIAPPAAPSPAIRSILDAAALDRRVDAAWTGTLEAVESDFVLSLQAGDRLAPHALALMAAALAEHPDAAAVYADGDVLDADGRRTAPAFKADLDQTRLQAQDYVGAGLLVRRDLLRGLGGPGADLAARVAEADRGEVLHLPHVLHHAVGPMKADPSPPRTPGRRSDEPLPGVLALIPTRDRPDLLEACVAGLLEQTDYPALTVCIIDNGSRTPRAVDLLARLQRTPRVRVLRIDAPFNFSALNNAAAAGAAASLLAFVNDDILVVEPDWLRAMAALARRPDVGAVGAKLLYPNGSLQHGGIVLGLGPPGVAGHELRGVAGDAPGPQGRLQVVRETSAVTAACMVVERRKFEGVGGFDEAAFPVAFNDVDLCLRLADQGYRTLWTPDARLIHLESATRRTDPTSAADGRFATEAARMRARWGDRLAADPRYNPNLTLADESFAPAAVSRARLPWR